MHQRDRASRSYVRADVHLLPPVLLSSTARVPEQQQLKRHQLLYKSIRGIEGSRTRSRNIDSFVNDTYISLQINFKYSRIIYTCSNHKSGNDQEKKVQQHLQFIRSWLSGHFAIPTCPFFFLAIHTHVGKINKKRSRDAKLPAI